MRGFLKKNEGILWARKHVGGTKGKRWKDWDSMSIFLFLVFSGVLFSVAGCGLLIIISHL